MTDASKIRRSYQLAKALTDQPWDTIGLLKGPISGDKSTSEVIDQLTSILLLRLDVLNKWREHSTPSIQSIVLDLQSGSVKTSDLMVKAHAELREYVSFIAERYNEIAYHAFDHAAHVTLSLNKQVSMIVKEENDSGYGCTFYAMKGKSDPNIKTTAEMRDRFTSTLGIGNDPLTQFALVFSALVHDVGHYGISNRQLATENDELALVYNDQSIAEQNSLAISFKLLFQPQFANLLKYIAPDTPIRRKFRRTVIHIIMCTDIASPDRTQLMKSRWKEAFEVSPQDKDDMEAGGSHRPIRFGIKRALNLSGSPIDFYSDNEVELKASSVLEQMMLTSDVAHLFQSFENFCKWNERLYHELVIANGQGRGFDPSKSWYEGQFTFIDNYVNKLAERLSICRVFGDDSSMFMDQLQENRRRWLLEGKPFCVTMVAKYAKLEEDANEDAKRSGKLVPVKG